MPNHLTRRRRVLDLVALLAGTTMAVILILIGGR